MKKWRENLSIVSDDNDEEDQNTKDVGDVDDIIQNENDAAAEFQFMHGGEENEEKGPAIWLRAIEEQAVTQKLKGANTGEEDEERLNDDEKEINAEEFFKKEDEKMKKVDEADLDAKNKHEEDPMEKNEEEVLRLDGRKAATKEEQQEEKSTR